jgi:hypothetical protein
MSSSSDFRSPGVLETKAPVFSTSDAERVAGEVFGVRLADRFLERFRTRVLPRLPGLRAQVIHNDVNYQDTLGYTRERGEDRPFWAILERLAGMDPGFVHCCFRAACGLSPCPTIPKLVAWLGDRAGSFGSVLELDLPAARKRRGPADAVLVGVPDAKRGSGDWMSSPHRLRHHQPVALTSGLHDVERQHSIPRNLPPAPLAGCCVEPPSRIGL